MTTVAMATSAAPTYFQPLADQGHLLVDGGIWANNPVMIAITDALSCFDIERPRVEVLSLGCGDEPYEFRTARLRHGGVLPWMDLQFNVMRLQSQNALGQARLLIGAPNVIRLDPPRSTRRFLLTTGGQQASAYQLLLLQLRGLRSRMSSDFSHHLSSLGERYGARFFSLDGVDEILEWIDEIEGAMSEEHRNALRLVYP